jgi:hypothetical protein
MQSAPDSSILLPADVPDLDMPAPAVDPIHFVWQRVSYRIRREKRTVELLRLPAPAPANVLEVAHQISFRLVDEVNESARGRRPWRIV